MVLLAMLATLGCAGGGSLGKFGKAKTPQLSFGSSQPKPNPLVAAVTDNPMTRTFRKGIDWVTPKPRSTGETDPTSLSTKMPEPTADFYISMAQLQVDLGNSDQASEHFQRAIEIDPTHLKANLGLAHLRDRQQRPVEAIKYYRLAVKHHPDSSRSHNDLGISLAKQKMYEESSAELREAIRLEPKKQLYRNNAATILVEQGLLDEALRELTYVHGSAGANYNLGYLLHRRGQDRLAKGYFAKAAQADPTLKHAETMLARLEGRAGGIASNSLQEKNSTSATPRVASRTRVRRPSHLPATPVSSVTPSSSSGTPTRSQYHLRPQVQSWERGAQDTVPQKRGESRGLRSRASSSTERDGSSRASHALVKLPPVLR